MTDSIKYFALHRVEWLPIPGRAYYVNLPLNLSFPRLADIELITHKCPGGNGWVVTHRATSAVICRGKTRAAAIADVMPTLIAAGEDRVLAAIAETEARIKAMIAQKGIDN